jgi:tetratricopeptide (TPR) repeat protein
MLVALRPTLLLFTLAVATLVTSACQSLGDPASQGQRAMESGDYQRAQGAYGRAIEAGTDNPIVFANRCIANDALGQHQEAVGDCTKAIELAEGSEDSLEGYSAHEVLNNRGVAYLNLRELDEALEDFEAAIELEPEYAEAYANRGRIRLDREDYELAIEDLDRAIEIAESLTEAYGNRGLAYQYLGDDEQALADFTQAIEIDNNPQAYYNRAALQYTLGRFDEAYADYNLVLQHGDPGSFIYYIAQTQSDFLENRPTSEGEEAADEEGAGEEGEPSGDEVDPGADEADEEGADEADESESEGLENSDDG